MADSTRTATAREVAERAVQALGDGDGETMVALLADDVVWEYVGGDYMPAGGRFDGLEAILEQMLPMAVQILDPTSFTMERGAVIGDGPTIAVEFTLEGKTADGRPYRNRYCVVFEIEGGLIRHAREYTDTRHSKRVLFDERS